MLPDMDGLSASTGLGGIGRLVAVSEKVFSSDVQFLFLFLLPFAGE